MRNRSRLAPAKPPARHPDRIDFRDRPDGKTVIQKFWQLNGRFKCLQQAVKDDFDLAAAHTWLCEHDYDWMQWNGTTDPNYPMLWPGARALRETRPIRTTGEIFEHRRRLEEETSRFLEEHPDADGTYWLGHDLAYFL